MFVYTYSPITVCNDATKTQSIQSMNSYANMWQDTCSSVCFPCTIWQQFGKSCVKVNLRNCAYGFISRDMRRCLGNFASTKWCHFITLPPIASCIWLHKDSPNLGLAGLLDCSRTWQNTEPTLVVTKQLGDNSFVSLINMSEGVLRIGMGAMWHIYIYYIYNFNSMPLLRVCKERTHTPALPKDVFSPFSFPCPFLLFLTLSFCSFHMQPCNHTGALIAFYDFPVALHCVDRLSFLHRNSYVHCEKCGWTCSNNLEYLDCLRLFKYIDSWHYRGHIDWDWRVRKESLCLRINSSAS